MRTWRNEEQIVETLHKARSSMEFCSLQMSLSKWKEEKKKLLQHVAFVFGHPSRCEAHRTGLNFGERTKRGAVLVVLTVIWKMDCL